ncbi:hypothetical protein [Halomonas denitrificans]|nr:hypothetical protein [Halomonas denitrificans]
MNKPLNRFRLSPTAAMVIALSAASFGLAGCGSEPDNEPVAESEPQVEAAPRPLPSADRRSDRSSGPPVRMATGPERQSLPNAADARYQVVPKVEGQLDSEGEGLETILDATSDAAFRQSLNDVAASTSAEQYGELEQAIRFLLAYDPAVLGSSEQLRDLVDGMTGAEVIARAKGLAETRYGNSPNRNPNGG